MTKLTSEALAAAVRQLPGWQVGEDALTKQFTFATFPDGIAFVTRVAFVAEALGHHPDISISYTTITLTLSTHSEGGVTEKDTELAQRIDTLAA